MEASIDQQDTPAASAPTDEGTSNVHSEQHRLLMTRDRMNLASVRVRAQDLQKTIMQAIFDLETAPERYDWPNVLERFAVMNAQLHSITGQMVPLMEHYVVHPKDEQQSKQLQDLQQLQAPSAGRQQAAYVQGMSDSLNRLVDSLFIAEGDSSVVGLLDPVKGQLRWEIAHTSCVPPKKAPVSGQVLATDISNSCTKAAAALSTVLKAAVEAVCPCRELEQHRPVPTSWKDLIFSLPLLLRVMVYPDLSDCYSLFGRQQLNQLMACAECSHFLQV